MSVPDLAAVSTPMDLAGAPPVPDLAGVQCAPSGSRICIGMGQSGSCAQGMPMFDRACPPGSTCANGYCQPPGNTQCTHNGDCMMNQVCDLYVVKGALTGYCTNQSPGNMKCMAAGPENKCPTTWCASEAGNTSVKGCWNPCRFGMNDCMGKSCVPVGAPTVIEGVSTTQTQLYFCAP
jgi:hypothetical protein